MHLDSLTLIFIGNLSIVLCGVFLLAAWTYMRRSTPLLWWAAANFVYPASSLVMMVGVLSDDRYALFGGLLLSNLAPALIWTGVRVFTGRGASLAPVIGAVGVLTAGTVFAFVVNGTVAGVMASFTGWAAFLLAASAELWTHRHHERLPARWPLMALFVVHALIYSGGVFDLLTGTLYDGIDAPPINSWFGLIYFEGIVYSMGTAIFMSLMCKECEERKYITAAHSDSLTGVANRGTFFEQAGRLLTRCQGDNVPLSMIVFDLDRFKSINDAHGHAVGDRVLRAFAETVRGLLRPNDLFGRHGGEEFAVALPGATIETAYVIAERIRHVFAGAHRFVGGQPLNATVSAGVASASADATLERTIEAADKALYAAKTAGRNRVARAIADGPIGDRVKASSRRAAMSVAKST